MDQQTENPAAPSGFVIEKGIGGLSRQATARLVAFLSDRTCGESCWKAKEDVCRCECGGKNHGIHLRGGSGVRACRIGGYRYELVSVGKYRELVPIVEDLCRQANLASGEMKLIDGEYYTLGYTGNYFKSHSIQPREYNAGGCDYVLKYATLAQCLKWPELEYFGVADDRDRYNSSAAILWKREDVPTYMQDTNEQAG